MARSSDYDSEDEWSLRSRHFRATSHNRRPSPPRRLESDRYRRSERLVPGDYSTTRTVGVHRTHSVGHAPTPNIINVKTYVESDAKTEPRVDAKNTGSSPRRSSRLVEDEWEIHRSDERARRLEDDRVRRLEEELRDLRRDVRDKSPGPSTSKIEDQLRRLRLDVRERSRSRSSDRRGRWDDWAESSASASNVQLTLAEERRKDTEERAWREKEEELMRQRMEIKYMKTQRERDEEEARIRAEEDLIKRKMELKYLKERQEREREDDRIKKEEERIRKEYEYKREQDARKREKQGRERSEERKKAIMEEKLRREKEDEERRQIVREENERRRKAEEERKRLIIEEEAKLEKMKQEEREIAERHQRKMEEQAKKEEAERERILAEYQRKKDEEKRKAEEERERIIAEFERKKFEDEKKEKEQEEALIAKLKRKEEERKAKEKAEEEEFERRRKEKLEKEKAKKKKQEKEFQEQMRIRLEQFGYTSNQIQAMIKPDETRKLQAGEAPNNPLTIRHHHNHTPTYVKVSREHLDVETLEYYRIPWEYDSDDRNYIIILQEMDPRDTEVLFEHTRRLRTRGTTRLLIEHNHDSRPEYAFVRRSRHASRSPAPVRTARSRSRTVGIRDVFF